MSSRPRLTPHCFTVYPEILAGIMFGGLLKSKTKLQMVYWWFYSRSPVTKVLKETLVEFNLATFYQGCQSGKFNFLPIFPAMWYVQFIPVPTCTTCRYIVHCKYNVPTGTLYLQCKYISRLNTSDCKYTVHLW